MVSTYPPQSPNPATNVSPNSIGEGSLDLRALLAGIWGRKRMIFGIVIAITLAAAAYVLSVAPRYTSEARVLISNSETPFTQAGITSQQRPPVDPQAVQSEVQVLLSKDLALRAIKQLKLAQNAEFSAGYGDMFSLHKILARFGLAADRNAMSENQRVLNAYSEKLSVYPIPLSRVIAVEFTSNTPELSARVSNKVAALYIQATREAKLETTQHASKWLSERVEKLRGELKKAEQAVATFRAQAGLVRGRNNSSLGKESLSGLNSQITVAAVEKSTAQARARNVRALLRRKNGVASATEVLQSNLIQRLVEQKALLRRQSADLSVRYLASHPRMARIRAEIRGLNSQIKVEIGKVAANLEHQAQVAGRREAGLRTQLAQLKSRASLDNKEHVKLAALEREAKAKRDLLEVFLRRLRDAAARLDVDSQTPGGRIISHAQISTIPSFPKKGPIIILAFLAALMVGCTIAFLMEMLAIPVTAINVAPVPKADYVKPAIAPKTSPAPGRKFNGPAKVSVAGYLTPVYADTAVALTPDPVVFGPIVHALESNKLATNARCILMATDSHHKGDMPAIIDLARALAHMEHSVLLIDANFRNPELTKALGQNGGAGLSDLLQGHATFTDVIVCDQNSKAHVMFAGTNPAEARSLLGAEPMDTLLEALASAYEFILIAGGPMGELSDAQALATKSQSVMLLAQNMSDAQAAVDAFKTAGQTNIAMILREQAQAAQGLSRIFKR